MSNVLTAIGLATMLASVGPGLVNTDRPHLVLSETVEMTPTPDMARITGRYSVYSKSAAQAIEAINLAIARSEAAMAAVDIPSDDIRVFDRAISTPDDAPTVKVGVAIEITVRDLKLMAAAVDGLHDIVGSAIEVEYGRSDEDKLMSALRASAVSKIKKQAADYAAAANQCVVGVLAITDDYVAPSDRFVEMADIDDADEEIGNTYSLDLTVSMAFSMQSLAVGHACSSVLK